MAKKTEVLKKIINAALDEAAHWAKEHPQEGVNLVVHLLDAAKGSSEEQAIMDGARERGFVCQYYPVEGGMGVRVGWSNKE